MHTPGPWSYGRCKELANVDGKARVVNARGWFIGPVGIGHDIAEVHLTASQNAAEQEANAKLISAAPALLREIKNLLGCCELNLDEMEDDTRKAIDAAREAVSLAGGWNVVSLEDELRDAWEGEGNSRRVGFATWVRNMAENTRGTLQEAAARYRYERAAKAFCERHGIDHDGDAVVAVELACCPPAPRADKLSRLWGQVIKRFRVPEAIQ